MDQTKTKILFHCECYKPYTNIISTNDDISSTLIVEIHTWSKISEAVVSGERCIICQNKFNKLIKMFIWVEHDNKLENLKEAAETLNDSDLSLQN